MATRPKFKVPPNVKELTAGLASGTNYLAQNVGDSDLFYCTSTTEPTLTTNIAWHELHSNDWMQFEGSATNKVWVRSRLGSTYLAISEA